MCQVKNHVADAHEAEQRVTAMLAHVKARALQRSGGPCARLSCLNRRAKPGQLAAIRAEREPFALQTCNLRVALGLVAGAGVLLSQPDAAECMPKGKRKAPAAAAAPAPKKKAGPALSAIEAALEPELQDGEYNVEKIVADRLVGGKKEYFGKWQGYADKCNTWEPLENLPNLVGEIAEYSIIRPRTLRTQLMSGSWPMRKQCPRQEQVD